MVCTWGVSYAYTILHVLSLILRMNNWHDSESERPASGNIPVELFVLLTRPSSEIMQDYFQKISYTTHSKEKWINHTHIIKTIKKIAMSLAAAQQRRQNDELFISPFNKNAMESCTQIVNLGF